MEKPCRHSRRIAAFMDGELPENQMRRMTDHLETCLRCQSALADMTAIDQRLRRMEPIEPSADFDDRFQRKLAAITTEDRTGARRAPFSGPWLTRFKEAAAWFLTGGLRPYFAAAAATAMIALVALQISGPRSMSPDDMDLAANLEMLQDYDILADLELLENWDSIQAMAQGT